MAAIITSSIQPRAFELIRDQIAVVLTLELANQYVINNAYPNVRKVWVERWIPFDGGTELPTVNVNVAKSSYDTKTQRSVNGLYTYNIDVYANAPTSIANGPGDQYAMIIMQKIVGMVQAILSAGEYNNLGFAPGLIGSTTVEGFFVGSKGDTKDSLSDVIGRVIFSVKAIEQGLITAVPVPLLANYTTIKINESNEGFYYTYDPIPQS